MIPKNRTPVHPGEILQEEFLLPLGLTQVRLAAHIGVPVQRINEIVRGKRGITSDTAWLLAQALGTTPEFWTNLQANHDLASNRPARSIPPIADGTMNQRGLTNKGFLSRGEGGRASERGAGGAGR